MPVGPRRTKGTEARARETDRTGRQYGHCPQSQGVSSYEAATSRDAPRWPKPDAGADRVADAGGKGRAFATDALVAIRRPRGGPRGANPIAPSTHMRDRKRGFAITPMRTRSRSLSASKHRRILSLSKVGTAESGARLRVSGRGRELGGARRRRRGWIGVQAVARGTRSVGPSGMLRVVATRSIGRPLAAGAAASGRAGCTDAERSRAVNVQPRRFRFRLGAACSGATRGGAYQAHSSKRARCSFRYIGTRRFRPRRCRRSWFGWSFGRCGVARCDLRVRPVYRWSRSVPQTRQTFCRSLRRRSATDVRSDCFMRQPQRCRHQLISLLVLKGVSLGTRRRTPHRGNGHPRLPASASRWGA